MLISDLSNVSFRSSIFWGTDRWQATMNGALSSGVRAAREILGRLG
jgi:monoamine oxidase